MLQQVEQLRLGPGTQTGTVPQLAGTDRPVRADGAESPVTITNVSQSGFCMKAADAPDVGRAKLNQKFAEKVGGDLAILTKERPAHQVAEIGYVIGDVKDRTAVLLDDMIDTAGTLKAAAHLKYLYPEAGSNVYPFRPIPGTEKICSTTNDRS